MRNNGKSPGAVARVGVMEEQEKLLVHLLLQVGESGYMPVRMLTYSDKIFSVLNGLNESSRRRSIILSCRDMNGTEATLNDDSHESLRISK